MRIRQIILPLSLVYNTEDGAVAAIAESSQLEGTYVSFRWRVMNEKSPALGKAPGT
jgi:hypothetical protein